MWAATATAADTAFPRSPLGVLDRGGGGASGTEEGYLTAAVPLAEAAPMDGAAYGGSITSIRRAQMVLPDSNEPFRACRRDRTDN